MHVRFVLAAFPSLLLVAGCANTTEQTTGGPGGGTSSGSTSSGSTSSGSGGAFDAGAPVTTYSTGMGPIQLAAGEEETNCVVMNLGNAEGGFVRRFRADLSEGSHHMIVYQSLDTTESLTPTPCQPLSGILDGEHPVFIAQSPHSELDFPTAEDGTPVGFQIAPNQMVKVEFHTINTTQAPLAVTGKAYLDAIPSTSAVTVSDIAFWGTEQILIAPHAMFDTGVKFQAGLPGTKSFAVTTHQHHLGTRMQVWYGSGPSDTSDEVADCTTWATPPLVMLSPPLDFPMSGSMGLAYECQWDNPTAQAVTFGESYYNEMCFLWHYYYPSQGFQLCVDQNCQTQ